MTITEVPPALVFLFSGGECRILTERLLVLTRIDIGLDPSLVSGKTEVVLTAPYTEAEAKMAIRLLEKGPSEDRSSGLRPAPSLSPVPERRRERTMILLQTARNYAVHRWDEGEKVGEYSYPSLPALFKDFPDHLAWTEEGNFHFLSVLFYDKEDREVVLFQLHSAEDAVDTDGFDFVVPCHA